jgi:hypothetical protein
MSIACAVSGRFRYGFHRTLLDDEVICRPCNLNPGPENPNTCSITVGANFFQSAMYQFTCLKYSCMVQFIMHTALTID